MAMVALIASLFACGIAIGVWVFRWQYRRADSQLQSWARRSNYQVLEKRKANPLGTGPMARSGNKQVVYRVTLSDENGVLRGALVKIGSPTFGVLADDLVVEWENGKS